MGLSVDEQWIGAEEHVVECDAPAGFHRRL